MSKRIKVRDSEAHERIQALEEKVTRIDTKHCGGFVSHLKRSRELTDRLETIERQTTDRIQALEERMEHLERFSVIEPPLQPDDPDTVDEGRDTGGEQDGDFDSISKRWYGGLVLDDREIGVVFNTIKRLEAENREVDNIRKEQATELDDFYVRLTEARESLRAELEK